MPSEDVDKIERYCTMYDEALKNLLLAAPRTPKDKDKFLRYIREAEQNLLAARTGFQEWEDTMREVAQHLRMSYEELMGRSNEMASNILFPKE